MTGTGVVGLGGGDGGVGLGGCGVGSFGAGGVGLCVGLVIVTIGGSGVVYLGVGGGTSSIGGSTNGLHLYIYTISFNVIVKKETQNKS